MLLRELRFSLFLTSDDENVNTNFHKMQAQSHDSTLSVRVDVRLCGGIPRKDMKDQLPSAENAGARCPLTSPSVSKPAIRSLAVANGPTSTLRTIACDERSGLGLHNSNMMQFANEEQRLYSNNAPLAQLMEPPSWAVPARGESRLEVSLVVCVEGSCCLLVTFGSHLTLFFFNNNIKAYF